MNTADKLDILLATGIARQDKVRWGKGFRNVVIIFGKSINIAGDKLVNYYKNHR